MAFKIFQYFTTTILIAAVQAGIISVQEHGVPLEHQRHHEQATFYHGPAQVAHVSHLPTNHAAHNIHLLQKPQSTYEQYPDDPHPQYNFAYNVQDSVSGDSKSQTESRDGDVVHGEYSLNDADGFRRIVKYTADSVNGFNAIVEREPLTHKVVATAPLLHHSHAPSAQAYASVPVQKEQHYYHH